MTRVTGLPTGTSEPAAWEGECSILVALETDSLPVKLRRRGAPARVSGAHDCQKEKVARNNGQDVTGERGTCQGHPLVRTQHHCPTCEQFFFLEKGGTSAWTR